MPAEWNSVYIHVTYLLLFFLLTDRKRYENTNTDNFDLPMACEAHVEIHNNFMLNFKILLILKKIFSKDRPQNLVRGLP